MPANAAELRIAVAANFSDTAKELITAFTHKTGNTIRLSSGSTGQLYAQIKQGAPFDIFLSADNGRPEKLVQEGLAVSDSRFTYAIGQLVLWSRDKNFPATVETLEKQAFTRLAVCNPDVAPYGRAAIETLQNLHLLEKLRPKFVVGTNIIQVWQFVSSGNAELGFVSLSQMKGVSEGSQWRVPEKFYTPIRQDAVLLNKSQNNAAARAFMAFLKSDESRSIISHYGYHF
ncbi:molybdate ABC transporter substrate-binding protein [Zymomonas mobilis]|nr:molybdate ABC transporter substrate-binding protein [Zymomonas mobilis]MDX5947872.1 molybdate ABC transporter substrate-binding protein [Zymomonas mobilis subsp. pomaceae]GEB89965.1 molybdate ABC transporter substrate-binding protein [Zymomonas mobilis subsp. pomaceae]